MMIGTTNQTWFGNSLPLNLAPFGAPQGCELNAALEISLMTTTDSNGNASIPMFIPNEPFLFSLPLFAQWCAADTSLSAALPASFSNGMVIQAEY